MREREGVFSVAAMSRVLGVTRQGYYAWKHRPPSVRQREDFVLRTEIRSAFAASRRFRVTTDSRNTKVVHANVLARDFSVGTANRAWAGDITYLWTLEGWLYLAVVLDVGTRRAIGWSFRENLEAELVVGALAMALGLRPASSGLIYHSDRGSQYGSEKMQALLRRFGLQGSMSGKGDCWDNAVVESFFGSLKTELVAEARWATRAEAKRAVVEWMEGWYNRSRLHSSLGYRSPVEFERQLTAKTN